jgi:hypothetical protein
MQWFGAGSLPAAIARIDVVFTGKMKDRVLPMNKKAWAAKFKKYEILAGVNERKKGCHGVCKARARGGRLA